MQEKEGNYRGLSKREESSEWIRRNKEITYAEVIGGTREKENLYQRGLNAKRPKIVFFLGPTKPPSSYD